MSKFGAQSMVGKLKRVLMKKPQSFMSKVDLKKWNYGSPLNQELIEANYREFYEIIENSNTEIIDLKLEDNNEELCDSIFTHDPSIVLNSGAVILNMQKNLRKKETKFHTNIYNLINVPIVGKIINEGTVEGGDCLWINNKTLLVGESLRTNKAGINQLTNILNFHNINVIPIEIPSRNNSCFHLMSMISMLDEDLAIGYSPLFSEELKKNLKNNNIKLLEISKEEYLSSNTLAVNILTLSPRNIVMMKGFSQTQDLLLKENCTINSFNGNELCIKAEGGGTCLTRPVLRE